MNTLESLLFENSYSQLPEEFWHAVAPQPLLESQLIHFNAPAAALIDLHEDEAKRADFIDFFTGEKSLSGGQPIAMCYSGHQFGVYVPRLGDGRAILLGQVRNAQGELWDVQVKGGGPTRYSRQADGRAVLRSSIREYLCSEAMHGLGIPTTRVLCLIGSQQAVYRERPEPGAMLVRMAQSHIRFGSFEYFFYTDQYDHLKQLADHVLTEYYPELSTVDRPYLALLDEVIKRTASMIAQWQGVGFAHGVMNSDNMSILGLTLDYGPFGFLDTYQAGFICNHSDHQGRYAFDAQPQIGLFNMSCLAQALLPLLSDDKDQAVSLAQASLQTYQPFYEACFAQIKSAKLGFQTQQEQDHKLWQDLLTLMEGQVDYTRFFRALSKLKLTQMNNECSLRDQFIDRQGFDEWLTRYQQRLMDEASVDEQRHDVMKQVNPKYILRNHLAETAIRRAEDEGDYREIDTLITLLRKPYDEQTDYESYADLPPDWAQKISVSCSS